MTIAESDALIVSGIVERDVVSPDEIRDFAHSQIETWRRLPYLALQGVGKAGYNESVAMNLAQYGLLEVARDEVIKSGGLFGTYVDCASGDILTQFHVDTPDYNALASDEKIQAALEQDSRVFDAETWLAHYMHLAEKPFDTVDVHKEVEEKVQKQGSDEYEVVKKVVSETHLAPQSPFAKKTEAQIAAWTDEHIQKFGLTAIYRRLHIVQ